MMNEIWYIIIGAIVGSISTICIQYISNIIKKNYIKKSILIYLTDIYEDCNEIIKEIPKIKKELNKENTGNIRVHMYESFNSRVLKSFPIEQLQPIYKNNLKYIINIIGILDNIENRLPYLQFNKFIKEIQDHVEKHFEAEKERYKTKKEHYAKCGHIVNLRNRTSLSLDFVEESVVTLKEFILILKK